MLNRSCIASLALAATAFIPLVAHAGHGAIQLTAISLPDERRSEAASDGPDTHYGDDNANELTLLYRFGSNLARPVAFVVGLGLDFIAVDYGDSSETLYGFRAEPGISVKVSDRLRIEGLIGFSIGSSSALWAQETITVRPVYQLDSGFSLHALFGYTHLGSLGSDVNHETSTTSRSGTVFGAGMAYSFR